MVCCEFCVWHLQHSWQWTVATVDLGDYRRQRDSTRKEIPGENIYPERNRAKGFDRRVSIAGYTVGPALRLQHAPHDHGATVLLAADGSRSRGRRQAEFDSGDDRVASRRASCWDNRRRRLTASDARHRLSPWSTAYRESRSTGADSLRMLQTHQGRR